MAVPATAKIDTVFSGTQILFEKDGPQMCFHILCDSLTKCSNLLSLFEHRVPFA